MNFETISELDILRHAYAGILEKWLKEEKRIRENPDEKMPIAKRLKAKYDAQMIEVNTRIIELEQAE